MSVKDTGPGIPEEEIPVVLSSFGQGSNAIKSAEQGTGLGLPIAKNLVDMHGGTFTLKSKVRIGTELIATFPPERVMAALPPLVGDRAADRAAAARGTCRSAPQDHAARCSGLAASGVQPQRDCVPRRAAYVGRRIPIQITLRSSRFQVHCLDRNPLRENLRRSIRPAGLCRGCGRSLRRDRTLDGL